MRLLTVSDEIVQRLHSPALRSTVGSIDGLISCGDLPASYLEYLVSLLNVPALYVHGNHDAPELREDGSRHLHPQGCTPLDGRVERLGGLLVAGVDGVLRYRDGAFQYTERAWRWRLLLLSMRVLWAQQRFNQRLDVLVTHTPPAGLHDGPGAHRGPMALRRFVERFQPRYVIHGHVHLNYGYGDQRPLHHGASQIINTCGFLLLDIEPEPLCREASAG